MRYMTLALLMCAQAASADCVIGAKSKTGYKVLDGGTIMLTGGYSQDIIIKTFTPLLSTSSVVVLKDNFCSFETAVLYINNQVVDAQGVTAIHR